MTWSEGKRLLIAGRLHIRRVRVAGTIVLRTGFYMVSYKFMHVMNGYSSAKKNNFKMDFSCSSGEYKSLSEMSWSLEYALYKENYL